jgi:NAD(P)-dependent dehydrogenase (short-subunit alcohol dehydrogenase family)
MLDGRVVMITGAASGIGEASAHLAHGYGAKLALIDRNADGLRRVAARLPESLALPIDIADPDAATHAVARTVDRFGRLDAAFNNAGVEQRDAAMHPIETYPLDDFDRVIGVNLRAQLTMLQAQLPAMQQGGAIVFTASVMGLFGQPGMAAYVASKHGLVGLVKVAALEAARSAVRVNAIAPGAVRTPMLTERAFPANPGNAEAVALTHPIGRIAEPEEIAEAALWLLSPRASFVTGTILAVDGGYSAV